MGALATLFLSQMFALIPEMLRRCNIAVVGNSPFHPPPSNISSLQKNPSDFSRNGKASRAPLPIVSFVLHWI
jgi:hypothetical protein